MLVRRSEEVMARLRVREMAEARGMNMSQLQRQARLTMNMVRRYWYNTADGKEQGAPLKEVSLPALDSLAAVFDVSPGDLFDRSMSHPD
jgi:DNA-binding Xre family transcriptional regulator